MTREEAIHQLASRQGIRGRAVAYSEDYLTAVDMACEALKQSRAVGEWMELRHRTYTCSECGARVIGSIPWGNYCESCGADMQESRDRLRRKESER